MSPAVPVGSTVQISGAQLWNEHANWWKATFTEGADLEYEGEILPLVEGELAGVESVLDLGCGEGQVARRLDHAGARVVALDPSFAQLHNGLEHPSAVRYVLGAGECLPFSDSSFEAVVCCLAIEHTDDPDAVLAEVARVLARGGTFLLLINHPMYQGPDSGFVDDQVLGEHYWRVGPYLKETTALEQVDANVALPFAHRPLSRYINPLAASDLLLTKMFEPPPLAEFLADSIDPALEGAIPRLLAMRFEHRPRPARRPTRRGTNSRRA